MAFPVNPGYTQYSGNFIPEIWSKKMILSFYDATVLAQIANTDYEGEIKKEGDTVNIRTEPDINVNSYQKGLPLVAQQPNSPKIQLLIDRGEYFNAVLDDVDKYQTDLPLMNRWMQNASEQMKKKIDSIVLAGMLPDIAATNKGATAGAISASYNMGTSGAPVLLDKNGATNTGVIDFIVDVNSVLDEANVPESDRFIVIPDKVNNLLLKSDLRDASITGDGTSVMRNGRVGMINGMTVYRSHNLNVTAGKYDVVAGTKAGLTFASQFVETEEIRSPTTFATMMRGLQVFGYKVVKPEALVQAVVSVP